MQNSIKINVEVIEVNCPECGLHVEKYKLNDFAYGERLLETEDGLDYVYVNCIRDKAYNEVDEIIEKLFADKQKTTQEKIKYFNMILGYTCDKVNNKRVNAAKSLFDFENCDIKDCEVIEKNPPVKKCIEVPILTFNEWEKKDKKEKEEFILSKLKELNCL